MEQCSVRSRTLLVAVLAAAAGLAALWTVIPSIYLANDDAAIRLTVTGGDLPGEPATSYLVFTHEALARVVVALQRLLPAVFVWDVLLAAALAVGVGALLATAVAAWPRGYSRVGALCAVLVTVAPFAAGLQFTISAVMCAGAALVVAVCELLWSERPRRSVLIAAAVLVVAGYTLRPMAVEGAVVVLLACLVPVAAAHRSWRARLRRLAAVAAIVGGMFVTLDLLNRALYPGATAGPSSTRTPGSSSPSSTGTAPPATRSARRFARPPAGPRTTGTCSGRDGPGPTGRCSVPTAWRMCTRC